MRRGRRRQRRSQPNRSSRSRRRDLCLHLDDCARLHSSHKISPLMKVAPIAKMYAVPSVQAGPQTHMLVTLMSAPVCRSIVKCATRQRLSDACIINVLSTLRGGICRRTGGRGRGGGTTRRSGRPTGAAAVRGPAARKAAGRARRCAMDRQPPRSYPAQTTALALAAICNSSSVCESHKPADETSEVGRGS
jgi:hypothetical protein